MGCDERLVERFLSGEEEVFRDIVNRYKGYVFAVILTLVRDREQAENIAQEVFIQIFRSLPQYRFRNFKSWVGKIATSKAIDWRRSQSRKPREETGGDLEKLLAEKEDWATPEQILVCEEQKKRVWEVCTELPEVYGRVMIEYYLKEKSYQQIALAEGVAVKTVESRLYRARALFKEKWREGA